MIIQQTKTALGPNLTASFLASGGTSPYTYSVIAGGAGGTIDSTGLYTAPASVPNDLSKFYDTIVATDSSVTPATASTKILVGNPWMLVLEIIQRDMALDPNKQIWFWNQKQFLPTDGQILTVVIMVHSVKVFASGLHPAGPIVPPGTGPGGDFTEKWLNVSSTLDIHVMSRDLSALNRKEELLMALGGPYSRMQQQGNSFYLARIPHSVTDASGVDGSAIPYHFVVSVEMQYGASKTVATDYFDTFGVDPLLVNE